MNNNKLVDFNGDVCKVKFFKYSNKRKGIQLVDNVTEENIARATINVDSVKLVEDEVIIKDYSENAGMYVALREAGIIDKCHATTIVGFKKGFICKLSE